MIILQDLKSKSRNRFFLLLGFGLFGLFGSRRAVIHGSSLAGAGALSVLVLSFIAGLGWKETEKVILMSKCTAQYRNGHLTWTNG